MSFLKQSTTITLRLGPALSQTDGVTERTALSPTVELSKAGGAFAARNSATAIAHDSNGWYSVELNATDTNTVGPLFVKFDDSANHLPVWHMFTVLPANVYDSLIGGTDVLDVSVTQWLGTAAATPTVAGVPEVDVTHWLGTAAATPTVAGVPEVDVTHWRGTASPVEDTAGYPKVTIKDGAGAGEINLTSGAIDTVTAVTNAVTVGTINANVITATSIANDAITAAKIANGAIDAATFAAGAIDATAIATDAIGSAQLSQAAANKIIQAVSGTADSGSTTTVVDAERTEADTDYWKGSFICFTSGTISGQVRRITAFNAATDTITFAPATTQAVGTNTYIILRSSFAEILVNAINAGAVDASAIATDAIDADAIAANAIDAGAIATGAITAAKFAAGAIDAAAIATGAIDADAIAADAITAAKIANGAIDAATFAASAIDATAIATGAITSAKFAAGAIDAAAIAADAIGASELATDAVNEIRDAVWAKAMAELGAVPGVTASTLDALQWLFLLSRNKVTQTATTQLLRNDADSATIGTSTVSDDGTTFVRGEFA